VMWWRRGFTAALESVRVLAANDAAA
jgi:hypothetical protein